MLEVRVLRLSKGSKELSCWRFGLLVTLCMSRRGAPMAAPCPAPSRSDSLSSGAGAVGAGRLSSPRKSKAAPEGGG